MSSRPRHCLRFLSAAIASVLSRCAGVQSIGSSVTLKSPNSISGRLRPFDLLFASIVSQKSGCALLSFGAYTFISRISSLPCHFNFIASACPSISAVASRFCGATRLLFITNATLADTRGLPGSLEFTMLSLFPKHLSIERSMSSSRCVSVGPGSPFYSFSLSGTPQTISLFRSCYMLGLQSHSCSGRQC